MKTTVSLLLLAAGLLAPTMVLAAEPKEAKPKPYPLTTCAVTDEKLGEMGEPFVFVAKGQEVKLCCKGCKKNFDKNEAKFLKKIEKDGKKK